MENLIYCNFITDDEINQVREANGEELSDEEAMTILNDWHTEYWNDLIAACKSYDVRHPDDSYYIKLKRVIHPQYKSYINGCECNKKVSSLVEAISASVNNSYEIKVYESNKSFRIQTFDHDGCNFIRIYKIKNGRLNNLNFVKEVLELC